MCSFDPVKYMETEGEAYSRGAESYEKYGSAIFEALASPLLQKARLVPGETVLDVAFGTGIPSFRAAEAVGPEGRVVGIDLAPGMVEVARAKAAARGATNLSFREADAESLPFADASFDVALCNMGLIHVPDRDIALLK